MLKGFRYLMVLVLIALLGIATGSYAEPLPAPYLQQSQHAQEQGSKAKAAPHAKAPLQHLTELRLENQLRTSGRQPQPQTDAPYPIEYQLIHELPVPPPPEQLPGFVEQASVQTRWFTHISTQSHRTSGWKESNALYKSQITYHI
ncbi:hypothetical protein [Dongshaea marina]|uniref:hypothetical protein n=1 Tax=Dongshaea marina TaxID=2047966 RepID=UPI000D3E140D|nr:hypothetical protein [Dongshaea marina]